MKRIFMTMVSHEDSEGKGILVPISLFASFNQRGLDTKIVGLGIPRPRWLRKAKRAICGRESLRAKAYTILIQITPF